MAPTSFKPSRSHFSLDIVCRIRLVECCSAGRGETLRQLIPSEVSMHKARIGMAPEGLPFVFLLGLSALVFAALKCWPLALALLALTWVAGHFFRDPERLVPREAGVAVSPADGRVVRVEPHVDPMTGELRTCISVFMNLFNVHVNRAPVACRVERIRYFPGTFVNASLDKASTDNERCAYLLRDAEDRPWVMVQIAGLVARRIVCRVEEGDALARGERYGMIRFGSRLDLYLPPDYTPAVIIGDKVTAGESILARAVSA